MNWILIAIIANTIATAGFADKEACLGRVATLKEQKIEAKCVETPVRQSYIQNGVLTYPSGRYLGQ